MLDLMEYLCDLQRTSNDNSNSPEFFCFQRPVIIILNTNGGIQAGGKIDPQGYPGSHWLSVIILPRNYGGLSPTNSYKSNQNYNTPERIFLYDSLPNGRHLSEEFITMMKTGTSRTKTVDGKTNTQVLPKLLSQDAIFAFNSNKDQQTFADNSCGYWAIYHALMTILEGNDDFRSKYASTASEESEFEASLYLRRTINNLNMELATTSKELSPLLTKY